MTATKIRKEQTLDLLYKDGWFPDANTWTYSSADSPTFVISINADMTAKLQAGMRIKLTQTTTKYFIVTVVGSFSGGATLVTVYGGTDYTLINASISNPYYSPVKVPFGFPADSTKWTVTLTDTTSRSQASPTQNTWYNSGALSISIPIGLWNVEYFIFIYGTDNSGTVVTYVTLSTSNNSESDAEFSTLVAGVLSGPTNTSLYQPVSKRKTISLASKTSYYVNVKTNQAAQDQIGMDNASQKLIVRAICAYL